MFDAGMTLSYILAIFFGLLSAYLMHVVSPNMNPFVKFFIVPFLIIYILLLLFRLIFPGINKFGRKFKNYVAENTANDIHSMSYIEIFPPIMAVFIIIVVLLYTGIFK